MLGLSKKTMPLLGPPRSIDCSRGIIGDVAVIVEEAFWGRVSAMVGRWLRKEEEGRRKENKMRDDHLFTYNLEMTLLPLFMFHWLSLAGEVNQASANRGPCMQ